MNDIKNKGNRASIGLFLIIGGLVLLLGTLGYLPFQITDVLFSWPMILVGIGLFNLAKKEYTAAIILLAVGGFFILPDLFPYIHYRDIFRFWPLLIVLAGLLFFLRKKPVFNHRSTDMNADEVIDEINIFGGGASQVESQNFKGGKITAVFGGSELSLERCRMSEEGAVLDLVTIFGGTKIVIPKDWNVRTEVVSIFGGFADKRTYFNDSVSDPSRTLVIKGVAIFGGGELRNF